MIAPALFRPEMLSDPPQSCLRRIDRPVRSAGSEPLALLRTALAARAVRCRAFHRTARRRRPTDDHACSASRAWSLWLPNEPGLDIEVGAGKGAACDEASARRARVTVEPSGSTQALTTMNRTAAPADSTSYPRCRFISAWRSWPRSPASMQPGWRTTTRRRAASRQCLCCGRPPLGAPCTGLPPSPAPPPFRLP